MLDLLFDEQRAFVLDESDRVAGLCPRRSGKSFSCSVRLLKTALEQDYCTVVYITLTLQQATQNIWGTLKFFNAKYGLEIKFNESKREAQLPNGSLIRLIGAADRGAGEKLRGGAYSLVVFDECKSFRPAILLELIEEVIQPALYDYSGSLVMVGTPGSVLAGPFYEATTGIDPVWSFHRWSVADNTAMPQIWEGMVRDHIARGQSDDDPRWRREMLGEWVPSIELQVFASSDDVFIEETELPEGHDWTSVLGLYLGIDGNFASCVLSYSTTNPILYVLWDIHEYGLSLTESAKLVKQAIKRFKPSRVQAGTTELTKSLVDRINLQYELTIEVSDRASFYDHLELCNTDFRDGLIKINKNCGLGEELRLLQWETKERKSVNKDTPWQISEAFLVAWAESRHRFQEQPQLELSASEKVRAWEQEWIRKEELKRDGPNQSLYGPCLTDETDSFENILEDYYI